MLRTSAVSALALLVFSIAGCEGGSLAAEDAGGGAMRDAGPRADAFVPPGVDGGGATRDAGAPPALDCAALAPPTGPTIVVTPDRAGELPSIVAGAASGTTILLADGTYRMPAGGEASRRIQIRTPGITLRAMSGDASAVILDGEYVTNEMITVHADDVTLAHFTVMRAVDHLVHVTPDESGEIVRRTRIYGMRMLDGGEQFVKINPNGARDGFADEGSVECSRFELTDGGRPRVERSPGGCYTGGIDAHAARGWVVRGNHFVGIYCAGEGLAEHAVHFWNGSRDTLVENNTILDCARGIGLGLVESGAGRDYPDDPYPGVGYVGHYDGVVRNNVVWANIAFFDTGIELDQARGAIVVHNTIAIGAGATGFFSGIDYRFANTLVEIRNNLATRITMRSGATAMLEANLEMAPLSIFVDAPGGDFHLAASASAAIDRGVVVAEAGLDIDGEPHDRGAPDIGADER